MIEKISVINMRIFGLFKAFFIGGLKGHFGQYGEDILIHKIFSKRVDICGWKVGRELTLMQIKKLSLSSKAYDLMTLIYMERS